MSQHFVATSQNGKPVTVLLAWDRPLRCFMMDVEETPSGRMLYTSMSERDLNLKGLNYFKNKLEDLGVEVPASVFDELERDRVENVGNRQRFHTANGPLVGA